MTTTKNQYMPYLPLGTKVLHEDDGELGTILNGFAYDPNIGWYEYEVVTRFGIERWRRSDFVLWSTIEAAMQE